ncbi:MAG: hypothetical protein RR313_10520 [Anaerovoracaceae bacterium]
MAKHNIDRILNVQQPAKTTRSMAHDERWFLRKWHTVRWAQQTHSGLKGTEQNALSLWGLGRCTNKQKHGMYIPVHCLPLPRLTILNAQNLFKAALYMV